MGRIQIYSASLQFQFGWLGLKGQGDGVLRLSADGKISLFSEMRRPSGRWRRRVFDAGGALLAEDIYIPNGHGLPGQPPVPVSMPPNQSPWWTLLLRGPPFAFAVAAGGVFLLAVTSTKAERDAVNRKMVERPAKWSGGPLAS